MVTELGTPIIREFDELNETTKSVDRVLAIDTVARRVVVLTDMLNVTGTGVTIGWANTTRDCCNTNGVGVGEGVGVGVGVLVAIVIFTFWAIF